MNNIIICVLSAVLYFAVQFFVPWEDYSSGSIVSYAYVFDIVYAAFLILALKLPLKIKIEDSRSFIIKLCFTPMLASFLVFLTRVFDFKTPFQFVEELELQMIVFAPLVEEIIFRLGLHQVLRKYIGEAKAVWVSSTLFGLSHGLGILTIPGDFVLFVIWQVLYTIPLGFICAKSLDRNGSVFAPILLHFLFNTVFYLAVVRGMI